VRKKFLKKKISTKFEPVPTGILREVRCGVSLFEFSKNSEKRVLTPRVEL
jgi:hypothetical protein